MRRDDDYLRSLLFQFEEDELPLIIVSRALNPSAEELKFRQHVELLSDAGLVLQISESGYRMTNAGHDYLEAIRSDTVWMKTKAGAEKIGGASLGMLKDLAVAYLKQEAAEKLGIKL